MSPSNPCAKAVVFLTSNGVHRAEAAQKFLSVPANLPRFFADQHVSDVLRQRAADKPVVRLSGRMPMKQVSGRNIIAIIEGRDVQLRDEAVYDSLLRRDVARACSCTGSRAVEQRCCSA